MKERHGGNMEGSLFNFYSLEGVLPSQGWVRAVAHTGWPVCHSSGSSGCCQILVCWRLASWLIVVPSCCGHKTAQRKQALWFVCELGLPCNSPGCLPVDSLPPFCLSPSLPWYFFKRSLTPSMNAPPPLPQLIMIISKALTSQYHLRGRVSINVLG